MGRILIYDFSGDVDEVTHLFPGERPARLAAIARRAGAEARIVDHANFRDLKRFGPSFLAHLSSLAFSESDVSYAQRVRDEAQAIADGDYQTIFINLWHGSGFKFSVDLVRAVKNLNPAVRIYGTGQKVDWFAEHILRFTGNGLDGLVRGLGYGAVESIVRGDPIETIPNVIFGADGAIRSTRQVTVEVDPYPAPLYDADVYRHIDDKIPVYAMGLSNQACPNRCAFCVRPVNYGRDVRRRSTAGVLAEMDGLCFGRGVTHFRLEDSTPPPQALTELARAILSSRLKGVVTLSAFCRVDMNAEEDFALMSKAGVRSLFFGLESLDDENLRRLHKGFTYEMIRRTLKRAADAGIQVVGSLIFPTPGETQASMDATLRRVEELKPFLSSVVVLPAGVYPHTEWGDTPEAFGIRLASDYVEQSVVYPIRYLVPIRQWKPLPFTYDLMGKKADGVTFLDIVDVQERFLNVVRNELRIPGIPDYYFLVADLLGREPAATAREIVGAIMKRDYAGLEGMFESRERSSLPSERRE